MADKIVAVTQQCSKPIKIVKWKVSEGNSISIGCVLFLYKIDVDNTSETLKLKATKAGTVHRLLQQEGDVVKNGDCLIELMPCIHPTVMKDMCAECGADLRKENMEITASVPMIHSVPELKVSLELAQKLGKADNERLLKDRKLVLLVDLDQTLIHTTNDNIPPNIKDVYHFQLYGPNSPWYHTRLRPGTHRFLTHMSSLYELHICTFGARNYAHMIAMFLDQDGKLFSHRILSRDECFNSNTKTANLKALFPCGDNMVCIIDDREDVWCYASNLIHVKPYHFFQHTGDINAPPGLDKHEDDEKEGVDLSKIKTQPKAVNGTNDSTSDKNNKILEEDEFWEEKRNSDELPTTDLKTEQPPPIEQNLDEKETNQITEKSDPDNQISTKNNETEKSEDSISKDEEIDEKPQESEVAKPQQDSINDELKNNKTNEVNCVVQVETNEEQKTKPNCTDSNEEKTEKPIEKIEDRIEETDDSKNKLTSETDTEDSKTEKKAMEVAVTENEKSLKVNETNTNLHLENEEEISKSENEIKIVPEVKKSDDLIEIEDPDDYLLYLEEILTLIHKAFYEKYDKMKSGDIPDLKQIIPNVRSNVLKGLKLVFSGLVPTYEKLEQSKAFQVAKSLGAKVTQDLESDSTHLVAVRPGTAKVNLGRRKKTLKIVTPDWLWACAERWEHVDERLYPLNSKGSKNRHPPPHCSSPQHAPNFDTGETRKRTASGRFMDTINPLMSFSSADIADMDREVEDIFNESESESENKKLQDVEIEEPERFKPMDSDSESSTSDESLSNDHPHGWKPDELKNLKRSRDEDLDRETNDESTADEFPSTKFRRGEALSSDLEFGQESNSEGSIDAPDEIDDGEWNMMGAALEREFLSNN